jgi:hypothetical protein
MKKLLGLLIIWLSLTLYLSYDSLMFKRFKEENVEWRAFLVYNSSLAGCMTGAGFADINYNFVSLYTQCLKFAYNEKDIYLLKWKK